MVKVENIQGRSIAIKGIGKLFYESGYPIGMAIADFNKKGVEVSVLHILDELQKNGWSNKTIMSKMREELADSRIVFYENEALAFLNATYEDQREMIFSYLFGCSTDDLRSGRRQDVMNQFREKIHG